MTALLRVLTLLAAVATAGALASAQLFLAAGTRRGRHARHRRHRASSLDHHMTGTDLPRIPRSVPDWHERGACNLFPELVDAWHEAKPKSPQALACRIICSACLVRQLCATEALERGEPWGIWGGLDRADRKQVATEHGYPAPAVLPEHGTNSHYAKHECSCPDCRRAHAVYEAERRATAREKARRRDLWRHVEAVEQPVRIGRRWIGPGQLMLPIALPSLTLRVERTRKRPASLRLQLVA
ncbi:WhiB family transcriptional regulator [Saccharomonospora sp. NPDC046836]|uniref:WhiB family transcriptional regulator n=1 Tax=Saccharomonospora sp. NPDC046836 TaxID=3156921 RepID=UPI0033E54431